MKAPRYKTYRRIKQDDISDFFRALKIISRDTDLSHGFLSGLITEKSLYMLILKYKACKMLIEKIPYETVTYFTGLSSPNLAKLSKSLKENGSGLSNAFIELIAPSEPAYKAATKICPDETETAETQEESAAVSWDTI